MSKCKDGGDCGVGGFCDDCPLTQERKRMNLQQIINNIGQPWTEQGGSIGGIMPSIEGHPAYALIVAPEDAGFAEALEWGEYGRSVNVQSDWNGMLNSIGMLSSGHPAVEFCADVRVGEFNDFYLPSRREASVMAGMAPQLFKPGWHWTSSQHSANVAFFQDFDDGHQGNGSKDCKLRVRAVRRVVMA